MKTLIISDIHLGRKFDQKKLDFLYSLFSLYDEIILNGDFWCYYSFEFKNFLDSKWNELFPVLKKKNTTYVYGNHDRKSWCDQGVDLFSQRQVSSYTLELGKRKFLIEHGDSHLNRLCLENEYFVKFMRNVNPLIFEIIDRAALNTYPLFNNTIPMLFNKMLKQYALKTNINKDPNIYYVNGHTHYAEFDKNVGYINTGYIGNKLAQYLELGMNHSELFSVEYK